MEYGPKYDTAVQELMQELLARLEQWMSVPDMDQVNINVLQYIVISLQLLKNF